jgi:hypothetical protein
MTLTEQSINRSVINRHTGLSRHKTRISKQYVPKSSEVLIRKEQPKILKKTTVKRTVKPKSVKRIQPKTLPKIQIKDIPIPVEESKKQESVKLETIEEAINEVAKPVSVERKVNIEQSRASGIFGSVINSRSHYSYNSILGTCVLHN